jgi:hypothetical protein
MIRAGRLGVKSGKGSSSTTSTGRSRRARASPTRSGTSCGAASMSDLPVDPERMRRQFPALTDADLEAYVTVTRGSSRTRDRRSGAR